MSFLKELKTHLSPEEAKASYEDKNKRWREWNARRLAAMSPEEREEEEEREKERHRLAYGAADKDKLKARARLLYRAKKGDPEAQEILRKEKSAKRITSMYKHKERRQTKELPKASEYSKKSYEKHKDSVNQRSIDRYRQKRKEQGYDPKPLDRMDTPEKILAAYRKKMNQDKERYAKKKGLEYTWIDYDAINDTPEKKEEELKKALQWKEIMNINSKKATARRKEKRLKAQKAKEKMKYAKEEDQKRTNPDITPTIASLSGNQFIP